MSGGRGETANTPPRIRLFVAAALGEGSVVALAAGQGHYLRNVMRLVAGTGVRLFNGRDGEWLARLDHLDRDGGKAIPLRRLRRQRPEPGPALLFAPLKKDAMDVVTVKATELGAAALLPVITRRTESIRVNAIRLRAQAIEAAEQCGRLTVPEIAEAQGLEAALAAWSAGRRLFVADPQAPAVALGGMFAAAFASTDMAPPGFLIGPEGGLANDELDRLAALPFVTRIRLGPRILRAETAAVAALACWQAIAGDWTAAADPAVTDSEP